MSVSISDMGNGKSKLHLYLLVKDRERALHLYAELIGIQKKFIESGD